MVRVSTVSKTVQGLWGPCSGEERSGRPPSRVSSQRAVQAVFLSVMSDFARTCVQSGRLERLFMNLLDQVLIATPDAFALSDAFDMYTPAADGVSSFTFFL